MAKKYIDAEKLIALLEQRKKQLARWTDKEYANQRIDEIDCILDVDIDSLQQEQPHWKPSKEQMEALLNIEGGLRAFQYNDKAKIIAELYEQLKRL